jgi:hypothetical protein
MFFRFKKKLHASIYWLGCDDNGEAFSYSKMKELKARERKTKKNSVYHSNLVGFESNQVNARVLL